MHPDFKVLLCEFNAHHAEFFVIGAHALAAHGHVRATKKSQQAEQPAASEEHHAEIVRAWRAHFG